MTPLLLALPVALFVLGLFMGARSQRRANQLEVVRLRSAALHEETISLGLYFALHDLTTDWDNGVGGDLDLTGDPAVLRHYWHAQEVLHRFRQHGRA